MCVGDAMGMKSDLDQGGMNKLIRELFGVKTGFHGYMISTLAR